MNSLSEQYDVLLADLDGTLYRGRAAVPGAVEEIGSAVGRGMRAVYVTNNASRRPADVARHLTDLGFPAAEHDVATSSQAAAALLARLLPAGATVLVVGTDALTAEVHAVGLVSTRTAAGAAAVVQGHDPDTGWPLLAEAAVALRHGARWVACNLDPTLPTERGPLPGNGSMVAALRTATERSPEVAGKPASTLFRQAVARTGARSALVVGDRLDTDIEGGRAAGLATLLVLTGVSGPADLLRAPPERRPDYVAADLTALRTDRGTLVPAPTAPWVVSGVGALHLGSTGGAPGDPVDALRTLCAAHWAAGGGPVTIIGDDPAAAEALRTLGLDPGTAADPWATVVGADTARGDRP